MSRPQKEVNIAVFDEKFRIGAFQWNDHWSQTRTIESRHVLNKQELKTSGTEIITFDTAVELPSLSVITIRWSNNKY